MVALQEAFPIAPKSYFLPVESSNLLLCQLFIYLNFKLYLKAVLSINKQQNTVFCCENKEVAVSDLGKFFSLGGQFIQENFAGYQILYRRAPWIIWYYRQVSSKFLEKRPIYRVKKQEWNREEKLIILKINWQHKGGMN